jgi:hypothetical protein
MASKLAKRPEIAAAIRQYEEELMPIADYRAVRQEMEQQMRNLATGAADERVRLAAAKLLHQICEQREQREAGERRRTINIEALANELTAMQSGAAPIELEVVHEVTDSEIP